MIKFIEKIWGTQKENQFKGFLGFLITCILLIIIFLLFFLRIIGLGDSISITALIYLLLMGILWLIFFLKSFHKIALVFSMLLVLDLLIGWGPLVLGKLGFSSPIRIFLPFKNNNSSINGSESEDTTTIFEGK